MAWAVDVTAAALRLLDAVQPVVEVVRAWQTVVAKRTFRSPESSSPSAPSSLVLILLDVDAALAVPVGIDGDETGVHRAGVALLDPDAVGLEADPVTGRNDARRSHRSPSPPLVSLRSIPSSPFPVALTPVIRASMLPSPISSTSMPSSRVVVGEAVVVESAGVHCNHDIAIVLLVEFDAISPVVLNL